MDFGCSDIIRGIELAVTIYQVAFTYENRADVRYETFKNEVEGLKGEVCSFKSLLERLKASLVGARDRYDGRPFQHRAGAARSPFQPDFHAERCKITGNFIATLEECEKIIVENRTLSTQRANAFGNAAWHIQTQPKIEELRRRLQLHTTKILLVVDRLSLELLTDLDERVDELLDLSKENLEVGRETQHLVRLHVYGEPPPRNPVLQLDLPADVHFASAAVAQRFEQHLLRPDICNAAADVPLLEGFDALILHYNQVLSVGDWSRESYLGLLKTRWLVATLKGSRQYANARPCFYYRRAINQVEKALTSHAREAKLTRYDEDSLQALPDMSFSVWPPTRDNPPSIQDPMVARANEVEIIILQLDGNSPQFQVRVGVFQQQGTVFRVALEQTSAEQGRIISSFILHTDQDRLIPRYALPTVIHANFEMAIFSRHQDEEQFFRFRCEQDLFSFQHAFTGYDVQHDQPNIKCQFDKDCRIDCEGRVQLWQDPVLPIIPSDTSSPTSPLGSSPSSYTTGDNRSRHGSIAASASPSSVHVLDDGVQLGEVKLPAFMAYSSLRTGQGTAFAMLFFELDLSVQVFPSKCRCNTDYNNCPWVVLERTDKKKIPVRVSLSQTSQADLPDPNTFNLLPFRLPRSTQYQELLVKKSSYVLLTFKSLEAKEKFLHELDLRFRVRDAQRRGRDDAVRIFTTRENQPRRTNWQAIVQAVTPRRPSLPPQIEPLELDTRFDMSHFGFNRT